jgi:UPF0176 protein
MEKKYFVLAYYCFTPIKEPSQEVKNHYEFFEKKDVQGRIYLSEQGINGQLSAARQDAEDYMQWLKSDVRFSKIDFKIHFHWEHVFPRLSIKVRKQLVALDAPCDLSLTGEYLSPEKWKEMLDRRDEKTLLLDVRNDYEWELGHFEGAELPILEKFREFPDFAKKLKSERDPKETKVMMYCTGGIRCELYSALLKKEGFEQVFQLQGGIIQYGLKEGTKHWKGKLFVFDDRLSIPISETEESEVISKCIYCNAASDTYYNCANMDCNELFLCCFKCAKEHRGCCCHTCSASTRMRPFLEVERPKPFRRLHLIARACASTTPQKIENPLLRAIENDG